MTRYERTVMNEAFPTPPHTAARRRILRAKLATLALFAASALGLGLLSLTEVGTTAAAAQQGSSSLPLGLPADLYAELIPKDNPMTPEKIALGEKLYFDKRLSSDRTVSCATCHDPATALAESNMVGIGIRNLKGARNSPTVLNAMFLESQFWDGRAKTLEDQAKLPIINSIEMGMKDHSEVVARVRSIPEYQSEFARVFGSEGITIDTIARAIATFERTQLSGNSPFDRFM